MTVEVMKDLLSGAAMDWKNNWCVLLVPAEVSCRVKVRNFFLISSLNLPSFSLTPLPLVLSLQALVKVPLQLSCRPLQALEGHSKVFPQPSLLQAEQPQLSQPFLPVEGFQPSDHCWGLLWPCSNSFRSVLCWALHSWTQSWEYCMYPPSSIYFGKRDVHLIQTTPFWVSPWNSPSSLARPLVTSCFQEKGFERRDGFL